MTSRSGEVVQYWSDLPIAGTAPTQVRGLVAAAALDALENMTDADTMIVTRVVTKAKSSEETCAYVYGRGLRLKKAQSEGTLEPVEADRREPKDPDNEEKLLDD